MDITGECLEVVKGLFGAEVPCAQDVLDLAGYLGEGVINPYDCHMTTPPFTSPTHNKFLLWTHQRASRMEYNNQVYECRFCGYVQQGIYQQFLELRRKRVRSMRYVEVAYDQDQLQREQTHCRSQQRGDTNAHKS